MTASDRQPPLPAAMTIPALLIDRAETRGAHPALRVGDLCLSYTALARRAAAMAASLADRGIRATEPVAAMSTNRIELLDLILGCGWLGAIAVPLNTALRGDALAHALARSGTRHVLVEPTFLDRIDEAGFTGVRWILGTDTAPRPDFPPAPDPANAVSALDPAAILFTSGTTGRPKGVRCPHAQFLWWGRGVGASLGLGPDDVLYNGLPLFHTNAINALFQALVAGGTFVLGQHFSVREHWRRLADADATVVYLLGAMVAMLAGQPPSASDRAHRVTRALSPATPKHLWAPFRERFGVELIDGFGSTETNLVLGTLPGDRRPGYLGTAMDGYDARVIDDAGQGVHDGTAGELVVRTALPGAFALGYVGEPPPEPGSWLRTGDRVVRETDGWFRFVDRIKDVIRRRGENISACEVEEILARHPTVAQVAVFPVPSELAEDEVMAAIVPRRGMTVDPAELRWFAGRRLAGFAVPRYFETVDALPLTETGKVRKTELRTRGVGPATWDAETGRDRRR
ncbi:AMP-binding protein [Amycolatopsis sp.]|jgi:crotonobetaine/carnitine-CoA ligase|uniref:AMP-binding protein n=1 Tax=Amycolatopsis sp. TaxID=37632 RepID=UPI002DFF498E|nr:AMP-binding protein [Amycolatopsis sp.]